jgi:hypothetical protein
MLRTRPTLFRTRFAAARRFLSSSDKSSVIPPPATPSPTPVKKFVSDELLKKYGTDFFHGKQHVPTPTSPWFVPSMALFGLATVGYVRVPYIYRHIQGLL